MATEKQMIEVSAAKEYIMANYPNDPLLKHIAVAMLDQLPKVDTVEVVHGQWIADTPFCCSCSICNNTRGGLAHEDGQNYCPNCGAKMGGQLL